jgi:hypothetical protein
MKDKIMESNKKRTIKVLDSLYEALGESEEQTIEEVKEELASNGIDVNAALSRIMRKQKEISMTARRSILEHARKERLEMKSENILEDQYKGWSIDGIKEKIKELIAGSGSEFGLAYRELDSMGKEELASALEDLELALKRREIEENNDK